MNNPLEELKIFDANPTETCIIKRNEKVIFTSEEKGVKPMIDYYEKNGVSKEPLLVIDRIMGKGAVLLADLIGAKVLVTPTISEVALSFAKEKNMEIYYQKCVPYIINRAGDGRCPIELAVLDVHDTKEGYQKIKDRLKELRLNL